MAVSALEAMADAVMAYEGWHLGSRSWRNRNPGNLRNSSVPHDTDADGYAVFRHLQDGYDALVLDLRDKIAGRSAHKLGPDSTLHDLFEVYAPSADHNKPDLYADFVAGYLTHALGRPVTASDKLGLLQT